MRVTAAEPGFALGIDVGGTKIAGGLVDAAGKVEDARIRPIAGQGERAVTQLVEFIRSYLARHAISEIGVAVPGGVDPLTRAVVSAPNLGWIGLALSERLQAELGRRVFVENDANTAAWAEYRFGAGRRARSTVLVTVGTGIGGGLVVGDRLHVGDRGLGGELGHVPLVAGGKPCECGASGCWEQYASGSALLAAARECAWRATPFTGEEVLSAAEAGDPVAASIADIVSGHLAHGLTILGACFDPSRIVLGGGLGSDPRFVRRVNVALARFGGTPARAQVVACRAELGVYAGLIGAADLAVGAGPHPGEGIST